MASCKISFWTAYVNLVVYGSLAIYALYKNWNIYGCVVMFLIIAPLVSMYLTAYMVTYLWYEQGKQITCVAFGSHTELLSQDAESAILFVVQTTFVFTMNKILLKITSKSQQEGLDKGKRLNRALIAFLAVFFLFMVILGALKSEIFRHPNQSPHASYNATELAYLVLQSFRVVFTGIVLYLFVKGILIYIPLVKKKRTKGHIFRAKFCMFFFAIVETTGSIYSNLLVPIYYVQYLRYENADMTSPWGSSIVPPLSAFFYECTFITLPIMAWIIYSTIQNKHTLKKSRRRSDRKTKSGAERKRANSFDSRRTLPQIDFAV